MAKFSVFGGLTDRGPGTRGMDGTQDTTDPNLEIGMNFEQWNHDRAGFGTSVEMTTGGRSAAFGSFAGPEVGGNYQEPLGEDRTMNVTYPRSNAMAVEAPGSMASEGRVSAGNFGSPKKTQFGKETLAAPQNYRLFSKGSN
jgi:hypothetical protein